MKERIILILPFFISLFINLPSQGQGVKADPPNWWHGMKDSTLQILFQAPGIASASITCPDPGVKILGVKPGDHPDFLFADVDLSGLEGPKNIEFRFNLGGRRNMRLAYPIEQREKTRPFPRGFGPQDVVYLAFPDRFANGDTGNDSIPDMLQATRRHDPDARHGGDLQGVMDHLDYLQEMGFTALWLTPVQENDMKEWSYHGYAITDSYSIDRRLGSNVLYRALVDSAHARGIRMIMDVVLNHWGDRHKLILQRPLNSWVNDWPEFTRTSYRSVTLTDPYAAPTDVERFKRGWFDRHMPDLNLEDPYLLKYLIQNTIWWIEYANLDGLRLDTQPYPGLEGVNEWARAVKREYPDLSIVGEAWLDFPAYTSFYKGKAGNHTGYDPQLKSITDFPMHYALRDAFRETDGWNEGTMKLYNTLAQDFQYRDAGTNLTFADNHDVGRIYSSVGKDPGLLKMVLGTLFTTRGMPMLYYGTEVLMAGEEHEGHGPMRKDLPGGWAGDSISVFTGRGLTPDQAEMRDWIAKLLEYRKNSPALTRGRLMHYIPEDGVYTYFRLHDKKRVMVILNNNPKPLEWKPDRYAEGLGIHKTGIEVMRGDKLNISEGLILEPKSIKIIELQ